MYVLSTGCKSWLAQEEMFFGKQTFTVVQSLGHVQLFAAPWTAARQASLPFTISQFAQTHVR